VKKGASSVRNEAIKRVVKKFDGKKSLVDFDLV